MQYFYEKSNIFIDASNMDSLKLLNLNLFTKMIYLENSKKGSERLLTIYSAFRKTSSYVERI